MKYPFEEQAMHNEPMPEGLTALEQQIYIVLRNIYWSLHKGIITKDQAQKEKNMTIKNLGALNNSREFERRCWENSAKRTMAAERAMTMYRKNRTLENADVLVDRLDWLHDECERPALVDEHGAKCPSCGRFFEQSHVDRKPSYCEDCGCRLDWKACSQ